MDPIPRPHRKSTAPTTRHPLRGPLCAVLLACTALPALAAEPLIARPELREFISEMVAKHGFDSARLATLFGQVETKPNIIKAISRPAEAKPWHAYRKIFLTESRISGGVRYWSEHAELLAAAEAKYGVPPEIIVAIIGVETRYGGFTGRYRVIDALATLAFDYPKRSAFFRSELEEFLLLSREEALDPLLPKGSYAGAMGLGQFIPSSYRRYAVDFDADGDRDLFTSNADAIGSVANYFAVHGWRTGAPVTAPAQISGEGYHDLVELGYKPQRRLERFPGYGVTVDGVDYNDRLAALIELETEQGPTWWVVYKNFYVITRYNHSPLYAKAVQELSQEIRSRQATNSGLEQSPRRSPTAQAALLGIQGVVTN